LASLRVQIRQQFLYQWNAVVALFGEFVKFLFSHFFTAETQRHREKQANIFAFNAAASPIIANK
jgi:hypothetical protein